MSSNSSITPNLSNQNLININDNNQNNQPNENNGKSVGTTSGSRRGSTEFFSTPINNPKISNDTDQQPKVNETTTTTTTTTTITTAITSTTSDNETHNNLKTDEKNNIISYKESFAKLSRLFENKATASETIASLLLTQDGQKILADVVTQMYDTNNQIYYDSHPLMVCVNRTLEMINPTDLNQFFKDNPKLKSQLLKSVTALRYGGLNFNLDFMFKNTEIFGQSGHELLGASTSLKHTPADELITSLIAIHTSLSKAYYPLKVKEKLEHAKTEWNKNETEIQNNKNQLLSLNATSRKNKYQLITEKKSANQYTDLAPEVEINSKTDAIAKLEESQKTLLSQIAMLTQENNSITEKIKYVSTRAQKEIAYLNIKQIINGKIEINDDDVIRIFLLCTEIYRLANDRVMENYCNFSDPGLLYRAACEIFEINEKQTSRKNGLV
ncbi:hypothetical protein [Paraburkholderia hayleyella]|uniref:hypothetical protein n=1 Tax=Paraburkholderia hayleyella TaxID=2152889 RepID=UPI001292A987|nr:hypothetical protein [Paraburkholderia hayleyella]